MTALTNFLFRHPYIAVFAVVVFVGAIEGLPQ